MANTKRKAMTVIAEGDIVGRTVLAPDEDAPIRQTDADELDYTCGECERLLVRHDPEAGTMALMALVVQCPCGAYNTMPRFSEPS